MPRRKKNRTVSQPPLYAEFKPAGVAARYLKKVELSIDEYEALRLSDFVGMSQIEAANEMEISRPTFTRLIEQARKKMVEFLVYGKKLKIEGGNIHFKKNIFRCFNCEQMFILDIQSSVNKCPACESENISNLAGGYGHGRCCVNHLKKKEVNYAKF